MFYLTPQERKFIAVVVLVFILGAWVQLLLRRDIAPLRWMHAVRNFKININKAAVEQFQMLPGIGAGIAARIVAYRQVNGYFKQLGDIEKVDGLTHKKYMRIKELISL